jgi:hypothetical protein
MKALRDAVLAMVLADFLTDSRRQHGNNDD